MPLGACVHVSACVRVRDMLLTGGAPVASVGTTVCVAVGLPPAGTAATRERSAPAGAAHPEVITAHVPKVLAASL